MSLDIIQNKINNGEGFLTVRRNGDLLEIEKENKQENDIYVGIVYSDKEKKIIDETKIKIYRDGESFPIKANEFDQSNEFIEKQYTKFDYKDIDNINDSLELKTENDYKLDELTKLQGFVLSKLESLTIAIAAQQSTNELLKADGEDEIYTISKEDIKAIGQFQNYVTNFHLTWDPDDYELENIDSNIFNGDFKIPEIVARLLI